MLFLTGCERKPLLDKLSGSKVTETITITEWGKWIPTHLVVKEGQTFTVTATGKMSSYWNDCPSCGICTFNPNGRSYSSGSDPNAFIPSEIPGVLVGRIGLTSANILKASYTGISPHDGLLELGINSWSNMTFISGSYTVTITAE